MNIGVTYYMSAVIGNDDGNGNVDLNDDCLDVAQGTPVIWQANQTLSAIGNNPTSSGSSDGSIDFTFTNVTDGIYEIFYEDEFGVPDTFMNVIVINNMAIVANLSEGTYNNLTIGGNGCGFGDAPDITLVACELPSLIVESPIICAGESINLADYVFDANGSSTITFHSNTPPTGANELSSSVSPFFSTTYYILATQGGCTDEVEMTVIVEITTPDFIVDSPICIFDESTVIYTGNANSGATYNWDFGVGNATPGIGQGPHNVSFSDVGFYTISLNVEDVCFSEEFITQIEVVEHLEIPEINCQTITTNSVEFFWMPINGANDYDVQIITGQSGTMTGNTNFLVDGLAPDEEVTIVITAIDDFCDSDPAIFTCTTNPCLNVTLNIDLVSNICIDGNLSPFNLSVDISGGVGNGQGIWIGNAIVDSDNGTIDPTSIALGNNIITFDYSEGDCTYSESISIIGLEVPTADFTVDSPICILDESTVIYTGNANSGATYTWNFDGGNASPGIGQGPHNVSFSAGGVYTVTLTVDENGCFSDEFITQIEVVEQLEIPEINCQTITTNSVEFFWMPINGANDYDVQIITGQSGIMTGNTNFLVDGLAPDEEVTIVVTAIDDFCDSDPTTFTCTTDSCPSIIVNIDPVSDICLDGTQSIINLMATTDDTTPTGFFEFSGSPAVTLTGSFDPDLANIGLNMVTVTYIDGNCTYTGGITINVFEPPTADFTVDSPICLTNESLVTYTGAASSNANYIWNFDGGNANPGIGQGSHNVSFSTGGTYTISLIVEENGCLSEEFDAQIEVQTAQVSLQNNSDTVICMGECLDLTFEIIDGTPPYELFITENGQPNPITGVLTNTIINTICPDGNTIYALTGGIDANGCPIEGIDAVNVEVEETIGLTIQPQSQIACTGQNVIFEVIVNGNSGNLIYQWQKSIDGGVWEDVINENELLLEVFDVDLAMNQTLYRLSIENLFCSSTSFSNEAQLLVESLPVTVQDPFEFPYQDSEYENNVLLNDVIPNQWSLEPLTNPAYGAVFWNIETGDFIYNIQSIAPVDTFSYRLINDNCPEDYADGLVTLRITGGKIKTTIGITPNDDGKNDRLVFKELEEINNFNQAYLVVFSRWGDIVYDSRDFGDRYLNEWGGDLNNEPGKPLPAGTYFYILRLNIAEGEYKEGEVVIIR